MCEAAGNAIPTVQVENERVRVTEWRFPKKGDNTGWHRHEYDYIVIPSADGVLEIENEGGDRVRSELQKGVSYFRKAGVKHDVVSGNDFDFAFVEVELLENG